MLNKYGKPVFKPNGKPQLDERGEPVKIASGEHEAYDEARKELYEVRHRDEVESRIAREEALATGAHFGKSALEVGMHLENKVFEQWKAWAVQQVTRMEQTRSSAYTGTPAQEEADRDDPSESLEGALNQISDSSAEEDGARTQTTRRKKNEGTSPFS